MFNMHRKNKIPFLILAIIHITMLIFIFYKKKNKRKTLTILLLSNIGWAYVFDYMVVPLLNGYRYIPGLLKSKYLDNIFGAVFSQAIYVPITALFISAFQLKWKIKLCFVLYFTCIERLFISLGVYSQNWWRTIYTAVSIGVYFFLSDVWYTLLQKRNPIVLRISLFHMIQVTWVNILFILAISRKVHFGNSILHFWRNHFKIAPLYTFLLSAIITFLLKQKKWFSNIKAFFIMIVSDFLLIQFKYLRVSSYNVLLILYAVILLISTYYHKLIYEK